MTVKDNRRYTMVFQETEKGNYISKGEKGMIYAMNHAGGWYHGTLENSAKTPPTPSEDSQRYLTPLEALKDASASSHGFVIHGKDTLKIRMYVPQGKQGRD